MIFAIMQRYFVELCVYPYVCIYVYSIYIYIQRYTCFNSLSNTINRLCKNNLGADLWEKMYNNLLTSGELAKEPDDAFS